MNRIDYIFFILLGCFVFGNSQNGLKDSLFLTDGSIYASKVTDTLLKAATIVDPKDSTKRINVEDEDLYSIKYASGKTVFYYKQDSLTDNWMTRDEMLFYMQGERDSRKGFNPKGSLYGSFVAGIAGGVTGSLLGPVVPFTYMALSGIPKVRIRHETVTNPYALDHDAYILGYERHARSRRRIKCLLGGGLGYLVGIGANVLITGRVESLIKFK